MYLVHLFFFFHFRENEEPERRCDIHKSIWWGFRKMHHGRTQLSGHMTWQVEVVLCKRGDAFFQVDTEPGQHVAYSGCQLVVPDLRYTNFALYKGFLRGSHLIQIGGGKHYSEREYLH